MRVLAVPTLTLEQIFQVLEMGGAVVRPQVKEVAGLDEMAPLSRVRYVDVGTAVPTAQQTGSIALPFSTIQQAADALTAGGVALIAPGNYTEPSVSVPNGRVIAFVGLCLANTFTQPNVRIVNSLQGGFNDIVGIGLDVVNGVTSVSRSTVISCNVTNLSGGTGVRVIDSNVVNTTSASGASFARDSTFTGTSNVVNMEAHGCDFPSGTTNFTQFTGRFCTFGVALNAASIANLWKTRLAAAGVSTVALTSDYDSIAGVLPNVTATGFTLAGPQACKISVGVLVPAVAAGQVGYVDVSLVGTDLEGLVPAGSILLANPTADLVAAGAGGGFINVRASAANTARFAFLGPLAGGASPFLLAVL